MAFYVRSDFGSSAIIVLPCVTSTVLLKMAVSASLGRDAQPISTDRLLAAPEGDQTAEFLNVMLARDDADVRIDALADHSDVPANQELAQEQRGEADEQSQQPADVLLQYMTRLKRRRWS